MIEYLITIILTAILLVREYINYKERSDLLDRIMSKSFQDYKNNSVEPAKEEEVPESPYVGIEEARELIESS